MERYSRRILRKEYTEKLLVYGRRQTTGISEALSLDEPLTVTNTTAPKSKAD
ncbi:MAG: hypothetical protein ACLTE2_01675 [Eubacteriales bacterium]